MSIEFKNGPEADAAILKKGITIINIFATWCGPCKMMAPLLEEISEDVKVIKVDVDENKEWARKKDVSGVPTTMIYKDGIIVETIVGFAPKEKIIANF